MRRMVQTTRRMKQKLDVIEKEELKPLGELFNRARVSFQAGTHFAIITIITITIIATEFFKQLGDQRYHVLTINQFYRNLAPDTRKNGPSLKKNTFYNDERCSYLMKTSREKKEDKGPAAQKVLGEVNV